MHSPPHKGAGLSMVTSVLSSRFLFWLISPMDSVRKIAAPLPALFRLKRFPSIFPCRVQSRPFRKPYHLPPSCQLGPPYHFCTKVAHKQLLSSHSNIPDTRLPRQEGIVRLPLFALRTFWWAPSHAHLPVRHAHDCALLVPFPLNR